MPTFAGRSKVPLLVQLLVKQREAPRRDQQPNSQTAPESLKKHPKVYYQLIIINCYILLSCICTEFALFNILKSQVLIGTMSCFISTLLSFTV